MARDRALAAVVRDALVVAVIAVLVVQAMRRWCGDRYAVPSDSMQPVLNGDDRHGDVVFVDLPEVGRSYNAGEVAGVVESVKAAADVYMPVTGEVVEVNEALRGDP